LRLFHGLLARQRAFVGLLVMALERLDFKGEAGAVELTRGASVGIVRVGGFVIV